MDKEQFNSLIAQIGTCEDDAQRRELLAQLQESGSSDYDKITELETKNNQLNQDNETLRSANMQLFLRIGDHKEKQKDDGSDEPKKRDFKDLFNEKGGIK